MLFDLLVDVETTSSRRTSCFEVVVVDEDPLQATISIVVVAVNAAHFDFPHECIRSFFEHK